MGKGWLGLIPVLVFLWNPWSVIFAQGLETPKEAEEWTKMARKVEERVNRGELLEARDELAVLAGRFSRSDLSKKRLHLEAIHALAEVLLDMEQQLNRVRPDEERLTRTARRLVLAFDAASHPHQPLWRGSYDLMRDRTGDVRKAVEAKDRGKFQEAVSRLHEEYWLIRPALAVAKSPFALSRVDSILAFLRSEAGWEERGQAVKQLTDLLYPLFYGSEKDVMAAVTGWDEWTAWRSAFCLGALTLLVLAWVSFKKYRETHPAARGS